MEIRCLAPDQEYSEGIYDSYLVEDSSYPHLSGTKIRKLQDIDDSLTDPGGLGNFNPRHFKGVTVNE